MRKQKVIVIGGGFGGLSAAKKITNTNIEVTLIDKNEIIVGVWNYLKNCSIKDVMSLPFIKIGDNIDSLNFDCIEQKWLMGFIISNGAHVPGRTMSKWGEVVFKKQQNDIAQQLFKIRHWEIKQGDYFYSQNNHFTYSIYIIAVVNISLII